MRRNEEVLHEEKLKLLEESLMLIERLKKLRALGAKPRLLGINPNILKASGLDENNSRHVAWLIKKVYLT